MLAGAAFADVLDAALQGTPSVIGGLRHQHTAANPPLFAAPLRAGRSSAEGRSTYRHASRTYDVATKPATPKPARTLDAHAREALETLRGFGASLDPTFDHTELRSAFRTLAKRFHPDRHPGQSATETQALAGAFNEITRAYNRLYLQSP